MNPRLTYILDASVEQNKIIIGLNERGSALRNRDDVIYDDKAIGSLSQEAIVLLNKNSQMGVLADNTVEELKRIGRQLFDGLLSDRIKQKLKALSSVDLIVFVDDQLVAVPWELLFDGKQFLCMKFNIGRNVQTKKILREFDQRTTGPVLKMLILADPTGDLPQARKEAQTIRDHLDKHKKSISVSTKFRDITTDYIKRHIRDYDVLHYAGHAEYDFKNAAMSGLKTSDGWLTAEDIVNLGATSPLPSIVFCHGCQSAHEQQWTAPEDDIFGIANAFLKVGVRHYIGCLWRIPDKESVIFAQNFYRCLMAGYPVGEAVRASREEIIKIFGVENIFWGSYVLYGDPSAILVADHSKNIRNEKILPTQNWARILGAITALIILASMGWAYYQSRPQIMAVLNFENLDEKKDDWNLSHTIAGNLSGLPKMDVIDVTMLADFASLKGKTVQKICQPYGISMAIKGEYWRENNQLKAKVTLVNPKTGKLYRVIDLSANDELDLSERISANLLETLNVQMDDQQKSRKLSSTKSVVAYRLFSQTWDLFLGGNNEEAINLCLKALEYDPEYLDVYKRLGNIYDVTGKKDLALQAYLDYARLSEKKNDMVNLANALINIGWIYHDKGDYEKVIFPRKSGHNKEMVLV